MIRRSMMEKRKGLKPFEIKTASLDAIKKIKELKEYQEAKTIGVYSPIKNEIEIYFDDKTTCYPKVIGDELKFYIPKCFSKGSFGIMEPIGEEIEKQDIDIIIVPLLAIDKKGNRLGYGKGYYDRYLKDFKGLKIGVGYSFQEVDSIQHQEWDVPLDMFIKGEY